MAPIMWMARASTAPDGKPSPSAGTSTILETLRPSLGQWESSLSERFGLHGKPTQSGEQTTYCQKPGGRFRQSDSQAQEARKTKGERKGGWSKQCGSAGARGATVSPCHQYEPAVHDSSSEPGGGACGSSVAHSSPQNNLPDLSKPHVVFSSVNLMQAACRGLRSSYTGLGHFVRASLKLVSSACVVESSPRDLWPVPPPRWCWTGSARLSPRRRRRKAFLQARHELLQTVVCCLNWEVLGFPLEPPKHAQLGAPISVQQHEILERIESMLDHFLRMPEFEGDGLGRAQEKYSNIIKHIQELPFSGFEDLTKLAELVHEKFDPYRGHFGRASEFQNVAAAEPPARPSGATSGPSIIPPPNPSGARPVVSDRVKWEKSAQL